MCAAGVPESLIQKQTGHKSLDALQLYERVTQHQEKAVSSILASSVPLTYSAVPTTMGTSICDDDFFDQLPSTAWP